MDEEQTGMTNCYRLTKEDLKRIVAVFAANKAVEQLVLFGSRAKGNYKPGSDIDLGGVQRHPKPQRLTTNTLSA